MFVKVTQKQLFLRIITKNWINEREQKYISASLVVFHISSIRHKGHLTYSNKTCVLLSLQWKTLRHPLNNSFGVSTYSFMWKNYFWRLQVTTTNKTCISFMNNSFIMYTVMRFIPLLSRFPNLKYSVTNN